jgi:predicted Zn-dependent peptidase
LAQNSTVEFSVNGLKVILRQTQKETLVMSMYFRGGTTNYGPGNAGIESLALSGIVECGTDKFSANDFNDQVDEYDFHLAGEANNDYGLVKLSCISKYASQAWKLFSSAIAAPKFESQKFDLLKEQKINSLKQGLSSPDARLKQLAREFAFANSSYATNPDGSVAGIAALSRDAVKNYYYNTLLNKRRMFLVVAGNISREELEKKIQDEFTAIPDKDYTPVATESALFEKERVTIENRPVATNYLCGIINAPGLNSNDYPAFRLCVSILHSGMFNSIRLKKQLSYAPSASLSEGKISYVTMFASTTQPVETVQAIREVLSGIKDHIYSDKTLNSIRKSRLLSYMQRQEVMSEIVDKLGQAEIMGDWKLAENLVERMNRVTAEEMQVVFNHYAKNITWAYIGNKALGEQSFK